MYCTYAYASSNKKKAKSKIVLTSRCILSQNVDWRVIASRITSSWQILACDEKLTPIARRRVIKVEEKTENRGREKREKK